MWSAWSLTVMNPRIYPERSLCARDETLEGSQRTLFYAWFPRSKRTPSSAVWLETKTSTFRGATAQLLDFSQDILGSGFHLQIGQVALGVILDAQF
jgi:hypothetical protein